ncbi:MAG: OadG family protein [Oscillospiraceae bacterium]|nr:OadG family protein [Oscillospiraceae bacterium]
MENITIIESLGVAILGVSVVFVVLIVLMGAIAVQNVVIAKLEGRGKKAEVKPDNTLPAAPAPAAAPAKLAKGSCGGVMLHDVPDATAAMIMAIVADELKTPLNELRFISIQEVK